MYKPPKTAISHDFYGPVLTSNETLPERATEDDLDSEGEVSEFMKPQAWHDIVASEESIFRATYQATIDTIRKTAEEGGYDVILEVGCGTGDIVGLMNEQKPLRTSITNLKGLVDDSATTPQEQMVTFPVLVLISIKILSVFVKNNIHMSHVNLLLQMHYV